MLLPNADQAIIDAAKLRDYLLSPTHPVGRFKASFFNSLGYTQERWQQLEADLRQYHLTVEALPKAPSPHGQKFEIHADLRSPSGKMARVASVWIVLHGEAVPRFITAFPGAR